MKVSLHREVHSLLILCTYDNKGSQPWGKRWDRVLLNWFICTINVSLMAISTHFTDWTLLTPSYIYIFLFPTTIKIAQVSMIELKFWGMICSRVGFRLKIQGQTTQLPENCKWMVFSISNYNMDPWIPWILPIE